MSCYYGSDFIVIRVFLNRCLHNEDGNILFQSSYASFPVVGKSISRPSGIFQFSIAATILMLTGFPRFTSFSSRPRCSAEI